MVIRKIQRLKNKIQKKLGFAPVRTGSDSDAVRSFKTAAWQSAMMAERYHTATTNAPSMFGLIRVDLYIDYVTRYAPPGARILDLGCGSGLISLALADLGYDVVSCDVSRDMLDVLDREKGDRRIETRCGDAYAIPADAGEFDMVISRMFIQHFTDWPRIVVEKARVIKPGGHVIFDFGNREHYEAAGLALNNGNGFSYKNDPADAASFYAIASETEMRAAATEAGLDTIEISPAGLLFCNGFIYQKFGTEGVAELDRTLGRLLQNEAARELMMLIEQNVMPLLPKSITYCNMTVLRK